jgi:hypothetical protein
MIHSGSQIYLTKRTVCYMLLRGEQQLNVLLVVSSKLLARLGPMLNDFGV